MPKNIYFSFVGCNELDKVSILQEVEKILNIKVKVISSLKDIEFAYNPHRKQYLASEILKYAKNLFLKITIFYFY
jgi:predicted Zn-dependent protease